MFLIEALFLFILFEDALKFSGLIFGFSYTDVLQESTHQHTEVGN